jgi:hypothetical protein
VSARRLAQDCGWHDCGSEDVERLAGWLESRPSWHDSISSHTDPRVAAAAFTVVAERWRNELVNLCGYEVARRVAHQVGLLHFDPSSGEVVCVDLHGLPVEPHLERLD